MGLPLYVEGNAGRVKSQPTMQGAAGGQDACVGLESHLGLWSLPTMFIK